MIRKSRVWLISACLLGAAAPASAQEVILTIPERRPPPAAAVDETPQPARRPAAEDPVQNQAAPAPAAISAPAKIPEPQTTESDASTDIMAEDAAPDGVTPEAETETAESPPAGPPPLPPRKPPPGDRPTVARNDAKVIAAREACDKALEGLTIDYERLQPIRRGACGAPAPILVKSIGADLPVAIEPPATVRCALAAALDTWFNDQVQPAALDTFGSPVVKIRNISSYKCRNRYNAANTKISEHAFANALDISGFELASGKKITVLKGWPRIVQPPPPPEPNPDREVTPALTPVKSDPDAAFTPPPEASPPLGPELRDASEFLRAIHADGCKTFNTVLGPNANAAHANHFHVDMKIRRYVTICE